jgi:carboxyl-terminal processing protease
MISDGKIGYIRITGFKSNTAEQFIEAVNAIEDAGAEGVIFDLRSNPGGYLDAVVTMLSYLVPTDTKIVSFSNGKAPIHASEGTELEKKDHTLSIPAAVLCNENSASAAELFTAAMRDYNDMGLLTATVIGTVTYKKGIMQSTIPFSNGASLTLTTALYNPPSDQNFHGVGVSPDVTIETGLDEDYMAAALSALGIR